MKQDKDPMAWEVIESEYLFREPWLTARREHVKLLLALRYRISTFWNIQSSAMS